MYTGILRRQNLSQGTIAEEGFHERIALAVEFKNVRQPSFVEVEPTLGVVSCEVTCASCKSIRAQRP